MTHALTTPPLLVHVLAHIRGIGAREQVFAPGETGVLDIPGAPKMRPDAAGTHGGAGCRGWSFWASQPQRRRGPIGSGRVRHRMASRLQPVTPIRGGPGRNAGPASPTNNLESCAAGGGIFAVPQCGRGQGRRRPVHIRPAREYVAGGVQHHVGWQGHRRGGIDDHATREKRPGLPRSKRSRFRTEDGDGERVRRRISVTALVACSFADPCAGSPVANFTITQAVMTLNDGTAPQERSTPGI